MVSNWAVSAGDQASITAIGNRANQLSQALGTRWVYQPQDAMMDVTATHNNGRPLQLAALLSASDGDFGHDVFGIRRFLNRDTGQLMNGFVPRYAVGGTA
jgi:hypothetical protein